MKKKFSSLNYWVGLPLIALASLVVLLSALPADGTDTTQRADYYHYVAMAYNTARYGIMGHRESSPIPARPSRLREPLYPLTLAAALLLSDGALNKSLNCIARKDLCAQYRENLMVVNIVTIAILISVVFIVTRAVTSSWIAAYLASFVLLGANFFVKYTTKVALTSEPLAALLLLLHAAFLYLLVSRTSGKTIYAVLAGLSLGLLVLTKAIFQFWPLLIAAGCVLYLLFRFHRRHPAFIPVAIVLVLTSLAPPAVWSVRNYIHFGDFKLSDRGGRALLGRAVFLDMRPNEYRAAICAWGPKRPEPLRRLFCDGVDAADMARFDRTKEAQGTFDKFKVRKKEEYERLKSQGLIKLPWDEYYRNAAIDMITGNPLKHASMIPLFLYRGMWIKIRPRKENTKVLPYSLAVPFQKVGAVVLYLSGLLLPSALLVAMASLIRRRVDIVLFLMPALYSIGIHSVFTTYIPRYSTPLVPILVICFAYTVVTLGRSITTRKKHRRDIPGESLA